MIKQKGNIKKAIESLKADKNNAVAFVFDNAKNGAGLLSEATVTIKDNYAIKGCITTASSSILKGFDPRYNSTIVDKFNKAGAAIVAKTNMDEFGLGGTGEFSDKGLITHPADSERMVGGSSSGMAASFNEWITIGVGSDTGDSVRLPASFIGKIGFKPSYGAVSRKGLFAFASSLDTVAWMTHNVHDAIETSKALYGLDERDLSTHRVELPVNELVKPKKVAYLKDEYEVLPLEVKEAYESLVSKLKADGVEVEEVTISKDILKAIAPVYEIVSYSEASSELSRINGIAYGNRKQGKNWEETMIKTRSEGFGYMVQRRLTLGAYYLSEKNSGNLHNRAAKVRRLVTNAFTKVLENCDVMIFPGADIAPKLSEGKTDNWWANFLIHANLVGCPSIVMPLGKRDNLPFSISLSAMLYDDKKLLSNSLYFEKLIGGDDE